MTEFDIEKARERLKDRQKEEEKKRQKLCKAATNDLIR